MSRTLNVDLNTSDALMPSAYRVSEIVLTNYAKKEFNIQRVVAEFTITESIYRSTLQLNIGIRDDSNFMEQAALTGNEWITVVLERRPLDGELQKVNLKFRVTEYPIYAKYNNGVQVYRINAISPHAYLSKFKKISRAFRGKISDFVKNVLITDLKVDEKDIDISDNASGIMSFIVPNMEPIDAMHWAIRRAFSEEGSPFYLYQTIDGKIHLKSHADLVRQESYREYKDAKFFQHNVLLDQKIDFTERAQRIISIDSDLNLSKPILAANGAYASRTEYLDISTKTSSVVKFDYTEKIKSIPTVEGYPYITPKFEIDEGNDLGKYDRSKINYIPMNSFAYSEEVGNYHSAAGKGLINQAQSQLETLDTIQHTVTLNGDFNLNCGKLVDLKIPPAWDPAAERKNTRRGDDETISDQLSGAYLVASVVHNFAEEYFIEMRVKRDSAPSDPFAE